MNIGIDADGVLTDMTAYICEYGEKYFKRKPCNTNGYSTAEIFNCSDKDEFRFGLRYFFTYCKKWPPRNNCSEVISKLNSDNHQLYEITARKFVTMKNPLGWYSRKLFENWLKRYKMEFNEIYYCSESNSPHDKLIGCRKYKIDCMIDDKPEVAIHLANNGIKVILFDAGYNREVIHNNIIRANDWEDVYKKITEINEER